MKNSLSSDYKALFRPISLGRITLTNRIAMAPMEADYLVDGDGVYSERLMRFYTERIEHQVGLLIIGATKVENKVENFLRLAPKVSERMLSGLAEICDLAHLHDSRVFIQLTAGYGRVAKPDSVKGSPVSPSSIDNFWDASVMCRSLSIEEIQNIIKMFGTAANLLASAGVDGIELHGHEGYLFDQFVSSVWNHRKDDYGGNLDNRLRFPVAVLESIKSATNYQLPVQYRFGLRHYMKGPHKGILPNESSDEYGREPEEGLIIAKKLEQAGFDALHIDAGCYDSWYWPHPPIYQKHGCMLEHAAAVKSVVGIPVIAVGRLDDPAVATEALENDKCDIVAIARGLLADEAWATKVSENKASEIRPCIGCYEGCIKRNDENLPYSCAVNPRCARDLFFTSSSTQTSKKVLIIGAGMAGMQAALECKAKGHKVTLVEKGDRVGGLVNWGAIPGLKDDLRKLIDWYQEQLQLNNIHIQFGKEVTEKSIEETSTDVIILATGSSPIIPPFPGVNLPLVKNCLEALEKPHAVGKCPIIVGGGITGCEIAMYLASLGKKVTIVEMRSQLMMPEMPPVMIWKYVNDFLSHYSVNIYTDWAVENIEQDGLICRRPKSQESTKLSGTDVILAVGMKPENRLGEIAQKTAKKVLKIGDCKRPRNIMSAIWEATEASKQVAN